MTMLLKEQVQKLAAIEKEIDRLKQEHKDAIASMPSELKIELVKNGEVVNFCTTSPAWLVNALFWYETEAERIGATVRVVHEAIA